MTNLTYKERDKMLKFFVKGKVVNKIEFAEHTNYLVQVGKRLVDFTIARNGKVYSLTM